MKRRIWKSVRRLRMSKLMAAAAVCCLLGIVPFLAVTQDTNQMAGTLQPAAPIGVTGSTLNPLQIGLLHWYTANCV